MTSRPDDTDDAPVLDWSIACADVDRGPRSGLEATFAATAGQRQALMEALQLTACTSLVVRITTRARAGGRYSVSGRIEGDIGQACVVTLDPIHIHLDENFAGEFCPAQDIATALPPLTEFDPEGEDEPFAIVDDTLPIGQLVYEHLALAIDPFPRVADAEAVAIERGPAGQPALSAANDPGSGKPNPFAALAKLKLDKDE